MPAHESLTMQSLKPTANRVTVIESDANEETRESGIIVPIIDPKATDFRRGVVLDCGPTDDDHRLEPGWVVYYRRGVKIGDVTVVDVLDVIAYLEEGT